ncbi:hypothetical protein ACGF5C_02885 [Micromonospora sp. NPDC047620]|uniref:hypothetical protein n=1 Tax=Micromonospora sp. NPDC047620 TaxID=3364251 RepID=UPI0037171AFE
MNEPGLVGLSVRATGLPPRPDAQRRAGYAPPPDTYVPMLDHNGPRIGAAFRAVVDAQPGGVVVHWRPGPHGVVGSQ